ncbi:helix-turn-helix domain-containing protein [Nonomuraea sp. NPDC050310]|uniref:helix-turn-helix domain-containing protein n=1 Tax=unclassified Nonomuraea TaxID=2593643 RepID=UPI0033EFCD25
MTGFGALLRTHRQAAGLTIEELSHASGVSVRAIGDMERGVSRGPQRRTVAALAEVLQLSPDDHDALLDAAREGRPRPAPAGTGLCELPRRIGDFTGREHELGLLRGLVPRDSGDAVAVAVWGVAGMGKSALAVHAAGQLADLFPDGRFFLDLRGMDAVPLDSSSGLARLLKALGTPERRIPADEDERAGLYRAQLAGRRCLIVLDNAADEAQVRPFLVSDGPSMTIVTSRRPLGGLEGVHRIPLAQLGADDAAALLLSIVGENRAAAEPDAVEEVARLCGHLPLALRIAGNRLQSRPGWTIKQLSARLGDEERRLDHLTAGDLHVAAAFALSYEQLSPTARQAFRWLAETAAPTFGVPLAAVLTKLDLDDAEDALEELTELGLLQSPYPARYRFHDLVRLYSRARLAAEETEEVRERGRRRMEAWLLETAVVAGRWFEPEYGAPPPGWRSLVSLGSREEAGDWLQTEGTAWLEALRSAARRGEHATVVEVAESMHWFSDQWIAWGNWREIFELSSTAARAMGDKLQEAVHLNYLSWALRICEGRAAEAEAAALRAMALAEEIGDLRQQGWALVYATWAIDDDPANWARELDYISRAGELLRQAGDLEGYPQAETGHISVLRRLGRREESLERNLALVATLRDPEYGGSPAIVAFSLGTALDHLGDNYAELGRWAEAIDSYEQALIELQAHPIGLAFGRSRLNLARALWHVGRAGEARAAFAEAARQFRLSGDVQRADAILVELEELAA